MSAHISEAKFRALKRQAKRLVRSRPGLKYSKALDELARKEGFDNWSLLAATVTLGEHETAAPEVAPLHSVTLTGYIPSRLRDGHRTEGWSSEEVVATRFPPERYLRFSGLRENFHYRGTHGQEGSVLREMATAKRGIQLMDLTGLKSSAAWVSIFGYGANPAGFDHTFVWRDELGRFIVTTEPYIGADGRGDAGKTCDELGWKYVLLRRGIGIHLPCLPGCPGDCAQHTRMYVIAPSKRGGDPESLASRLTPL